jgi:hypothetical protein
MTEATINVETKKDEVEEPLSILMEKFPIREDEHTAKYTLVGNHTYRVSFWKEKNPDQNCPIKAPTVCRNYYIKMSLVGEKWHTDVVQENEFF